MVNVKKTKGIIAILTGGGDVPGLNPAIRAVTIRANREGYKVIGLRRGWAGITELLRDAKADNSNCYQHLTDDIELSFTLQEQDQAICRRKACLNICREYIMKK